MGAEADAAASAQNRDRRLVDHVVGAVEVRR
jgi:hypothetical protein